MGASPFQGLEMKMVSHPARSRKTPEAAINRLLNAWKCSRAELTYSPDRGGWSIRGTPVNTGWPHPDMVVFQPFPLGKGKTLDEAIADAAAKVPNQ